MDNNLILIYPLLNILSIYKLENMGLKYELSEEDLIKFHRKINLAKENTLEIKETDENNKNIKENINLLKDFKPPLAIFSHINISFKKNINDNNEDTINEEKVISPKNQALLIINEIEIAKYLHDNIIFNNSSLSSETEKILGLIFLDSAIKQGQYCFENLRNNLGFFVNKKIKSERDNNLSKLNLLIENENLNGIDWENQAYMLWAYYELYKVLEDNNFKRYYNKENADYFKKKFFDILEKILSNENDIINLETNILSSIFSPIIKSLKEFDAEENNKYFILSISEELYSREFDQGYIYSDKNRSKAASLSTHFKTIESLIDAYYSTEFDCFLYLSERIFKNLSWFWDDELNLYNLVNDKDIKYTSKTISYILKSLNKLFNTTNSEGIKRKAKKHLDEILDSSIIKLGLPNNEFFTNYSLLKTSESIKIENLIKIAPSFLIKSCFKINPDNNKLSLYEKNIIVEYNLFLTNALFEIATNS